jgi:hypothetical protein
MLVNVLHLADASGRDAQKHSQRWEGTGAVQQDTSACRPAASRGAWRFHNWLEAQVLRREAEALIEPTGPRSVLEKQAAGAPHK